MTTTQPPPPAPFTTEDYAARMRRVVADAARAGLDGLLVTPGPDLVWLTGYQPTAITERLTVLVLAPDQEPTLLVPTLERPDAEAAVGAPSLAIVDWADGEDPFARAGALLRPDGDHGHLGLRLGDAPARAAGRGARIVVPLADAEPAHAPRGQGRQRAGPAGGGRRRRGRDVRARSSRSGSPAGRRPTSPPTWRGCCASSGTSRSTSPSSAPGPNGANPHHEAGDRIIEVGDAVVLDFGGLMYGYGSDTSRTVCVGEPSAAGPRGPRGRAAGAAGRRRGGPAGRRLPGDRPGGPDGDHRRGVRRAVHPPHRPRHRHHDARTAVHDRGRGAAAGARDVLLGRARHLPRRRVRRPDRGHRHRHRRPAVGGSTTPTATSASSSRHVRGPMPEWTRADLKITRRG